MTRASGGNLARTPGLHPTLYEKCHGIFNDHRESGPRFNVSSERRDFEDVNNIKMQRIFTMANICLKTDGAQKQCLVAGVYLYK